MYGNNKFIFNCSGIINALALYYSMRKIDGYKFGGMANFQQPLTKLFERASSILGISSPGAIKAPALDGEIVYSKNNVCVHQLGSEEPAPGYLSLRCSISEKVSL